MPDFRLPLSGDVTQAINPWNWFFRFTGGQFGLVNVNLGKSGDPELEQRILEDVGSYGRQIGQLGDVVRILVDRLPAKSLSAAEKRAVAALLSQLDEVDRLKDKRRAERQAPAAAGSGPA